VTRVEAPAPAEVPLPPAVAPDPVQAAAVPEAAPPTLAAAVPTAPLAAPAPADAPETPSLISRFLPFDTASLREGVNRVFAALNPGLPAFEEWSPADWASVAAALAAGAGAAYLARGRQTRRAARHARVRIA
jgi:hypothetical protein